MSTSRPSHLRLTRTYEIGTVINPVLQMKKLGHDVLVTECNLG